MAWQEQWIKNHGSKSKDAYREQELETLVVALWSFIESHEEWPREKQTREFFKLRERVRSI